MKDKKIAKLLAKKIFFPSFGENKVDAAIKAFVERVAIPADVESFSYEGLESYIRDALARGTDHWDFCSPDLTNITMEHLRAEEALLGELDSVFWKQTDIDLPDLDGLYPVTDITLPNDAE